MEQISLIIQGTQLSITFADEGVVLSKLLSLDRAIDLGERIKRASQIIKNRIAFEAEQERIKNLPPVDRSARVLSDGQPVTPDHTEIRADGMQKGYVVLTPEERAKGFVRPVRRSYTHLPCGTLTTMSQSIAETYARDPKFYGGTYCCACRTHFSLDQFVWVGTTDKVGS